MTDTKGAWVTATGAVLGAVLGALIGAGATIGAAHIGLSKPSEKQLNNSEQYTKLGEELEIRKGELGKLQGQLQALNNENQTLRNDLTAARAKQDSANANEQGPGASPLLPNGQPPKAVPATAIGSNGQGKERRYMLQLRAMDTVTSQGLTATLLDINRQGATLVVNGHKVSHIKPGRRLVVASAEQDNCFVEVIGFSSADSQPLTMRLDHVCEPKRR